MEDEIALERLSKLDLQYHEWRTSVTEKLKNIWEKFGNNRERKNAKKTFNDSKDYGTRAMSFLHAYITPDEVWSLAINFAWESIGDGNTIERGIEFCLVFVLGLDLIGWKVKEFLKGAGDILKRDETIDFGKLQSWLRNQFPHQTMDATMDMIGRIDENESGISPRAFLNILLGQVNDHAFMNWFYTALMNEGRDVEDHIRVCMPTFDNTLKLVSHAVKHGTLMCKESIKVVG